MRKHEKGKRTLERSPSGEFVDVQFVVDPVLDDERNGKIYMNIQIWAMAHHSIYLPSSHSSLSVELFLFNVVFSSLEFVGT